MSEAWDHGLQVFDLTRLRGRDGLPDEADEPDAVHLGFGQAHNIVANVDTGYVYVVGAFDPPAVDCLGKLSQTPCRKQCIGFNLSFSLNMHSGCMHGYV